MEHNCPVRPPGEILRYIRKNLRYDSGFVYSLKSRRFIGSKSNGCKVYDGYSRATIKGKTIKIHHIVWFICKGYWPRLQLDHVNRDKSNNRIENLEEKTHLENMKNRKFNCRSK